MAGCERLEKCPFFNDRMADMPITAELYKNQFCRGGFADCARYDVAKNLGSNRVPEDLFPNQMARARSLIAS